MGVFNHPELLSTPRRFMLQATYTCCVKLHHPGNTQRKCKPMQTLILSAQFPPLPTTPQGP